ncbi:MAG TPA: galactokinase family protein [Candidatus Binatia bacterium]|nr:galactokinase family protein [Candidatus Binatia bacterium]
MNPDVISLFKRQFAHTPPHVVQAPGRLELLGNHTDYNQGLVLSLAIDKHIWIAIAARNDGRVELVSSAFREKESFAITNLEKNPEAPWADYVKGVLAQLRQREIPIRGFNAAIHSSIPLGAGMSSSAALEIATALAVRRISPYAFKPSGASFIPKLDDRGQAPPLTATDRFELAKIGQAAENEFVGAQTGMLDQISSLFGKAFHAIEIDFETPSVEHVPMIGEIAIAVCDSGVKHALSGGEYNALRQLCESAAAKLRLKSLRRADPRLLEVNKEKLSQREYQCAAHITGEVQRVIFGARALRQDDFEQFGQYMFQSHESSRDLFQNSTPELDQLVDLARAHPACYGARLTGGGFGGATINLVRREQVKDFIRAIAESYEEKTGHKTEPMLCQIVDGAQ